MNKPIFELITYKLRVLLSCQGHFSANFGKFSTHRKANRARNDEFSTTTGLFIFIAWHKVGMIANVSGFV